MTNKLIAKRMGAWPMLGLPAIITMPLLALTSPTGALIAHFNLTRAVAATIVTLIITGSWEIYFLFPWIIPVEVTVQALIAAFGSAYAIGW